MSLTPYHRDDLVTLYHGDCIEVMRALPDSSVDAVVTDPPYGLEFMGKEWDAPKPSWDKRGQGEERGFKGKGRAPVSGFDSYMAGYPFQEWAQEWATEALRVLKPGGHLLAFGGTRTWHRLACAIEDAGFEVRDSIAWMYGSGFPKSLDVSKAIDKAAGATREVVGVDPRYVGMSDNAKRALGSVVHDGTGGTGFSGDPSLVTAPATPEAARWQGWGTALKPAFEPIVVARKPLIGTVAQNVLAHGTGALNVDAARISADEGRPLIISKSEESTGILGDGLNGSSNGGTTTQGRWPANVILDESQARALDAMSGVLPPATSRTKRPDRDPFSTGEAALERDEVYTDTGGASRFFYTAKADSSERPRVRREGGSDNATTYGQMKVRECNVCGSRAKAAGGERDGKTWPTCGHEDWSWVEQQSTKEEWIAHPTVKPLDLMRYLVRLVTPPGGVVLEPFAGSGTTLEACIVEGFSCIGIEREADYIPLIMQRITKPIEVTLL